MFRKLLISLVLMVAPAFAQEYTYNTIQTPVAEQNYTVIESQTTSLQNIQETGTSIPLYDDGVTTVELGFDFYFYGNVYDSINISQNGFISFTSLANGCCNGYELPYFTELNEFNESYFQWINVHNSIFAMWSDLADFSFGNPYYRGVNDSFTVGWYGVEELGSGGFECNEQGCFPVGSPNTFNFEITLYSNNNFSISYGDFSFNNQTWRTFTSGIQGDQEGEFYQIYHGNDPTYLENKTFLFSSSEISIIPVVPEEPEEPKQNCIVNPTNPNCVINAVVEPTVDVSNETMLVAEESLFIEEPISVANEETIVEEKLLEELLADSLSQLAGEDKLSAMADEQKAATLEDSISKNVLEAALAIATTAESSSLSVSVDSSDSPQTLIASNEDMQQESSNAGDASLDILETGRAIGQEALAATMLATEASAMDSLSEAEGISMISSFGSIDSSQSADSTNAVQLEMSNDNAVSDSSSETNNEILFASFESNEGNSDFTAQEDVQSLGFTNISQEFLDQETEEFALAIVASSASAGQEKTFDNEYNADVEMTNSMIDPALAAANAFNQAPNLMNLEILGIVKSNEDKSDAELRAEQVVAANKEEQDAINANYMEADQSGILAAIGSDTDVTAYRSAMLNDNNIWYRPEDIYKNIVIRDNVRGMYFLEKGSTDTYKKMIDEQYK